MDCCGASSSDPIREAGADAMGSLLPTATDTLGLSTSLSQYGFHIGVETCQH